MKKLTVIGLCIASISSAYAGTCREDSISLRGPQTYVDDEFLYTGQLNWDIKKGYECDNEYCGAGITVTMFPGHYWKGEQINETRTYKCKTGVLGDKWEIESKNVDGDFIAERWCNYDTSSSPDHNFKSFYANLDDNFDSIKKNLYGDDREHAFGIRAECTQDGWTEFTVINCNLPYVKCDHHCVYYKEVLDKMVGNGVTHQEFAEFLGAPEDEYEDFAAGRMAVDTVKSFIKSYRHDAINYMTVNAGCSDGHI